MNRPLEVRGHAVRVVSEVAPDKWHLPKAQAIVHGTMAKNGLPSGERVTLATLNHGRNGNLTKQS